VGCSGVPAPFLSKRYEIFDKLYSQQSVEVYEQYKAGFDKSIKLFPAKKDLLKDKKYLKNKKKDCINKHIPDYKKMIHQSSWTAEGRKKHVTTVKMSEAEKRELNDYIDGLSKQSKPKAPEERELSYQRGSYRGDLKNGKPHGMGTWTKYDDSKYVGQWEDGLKQGQGTQYLHGKVEYVGQFEMNEINGQGTLYSPDGEIKYQGGWRDGERYGSGVAYLDNGSFHSNSWRGYRNAGWGTFTFDNGGSASYKLVGGSWVSD